MKAFKGKSFVAPVEKDRKEMGKFQEKVDQKYVSSRGKISNGYKKGDFKELHIMCLDSNKISTSCFMCRQVISELFDKDAIVTCYNNIGEKEEYKVSELCPYPFDEDDLK